MYFTIIAFSIFFIFLLLLSYMMVRRRYAQSGMNIYQIENRISRLLYNGIDGAFVVIIDKETGLWVQFRKYIDDVSPYGIELSFPKARWSVHFFEKLEEVLKKNNYSYKIEREIPTKKMEFLYVDCGKNIKKAVDIFELVMYYVFEIKEGSLFCVELHDCNYTNEKIDSLEKENKIQIKRKKALHPYFLNLTKTSIWNVFILVALICIQLIGVVGILYDVISRFFAEKNSGLVLNHIDYVISFLIWSLIIIIGSFHATTHSFSIGRKKYLTHRNKTSENIEMSVKRLYFTSRLNIVSVFVIAVGVLALLF